MASPRKSRLIIVTPGDPDGVGPEITWKILRSERFKKKGISILCVGAREPFDRLKAPVIEAKGLLTEAVPPKSKKPFVWLLRAPSVAPKKADGTEAFLPGFQSGWAIEKAVSLIKSGLASAIVTGPISKERLQKGGYPFTGHTDFLAHLCADMARRPEGAAPGVPPEVTMMLANDQLRISLVTTHVALKDVSSHLSREKVRRAVIQTAEHLRSWWKISRPKIAVLGLNPHAGENGLFGNEELQVIGPEIRALQDQGRGRYELSGPHPADTLFAKHHLAPKKDRYDAVVCMYHDQGLIPVKLLDFPRTVNVTLGLPIIRTSVDHGVGFDIAGKNRADPSSLQSAIELALELSRK